MTLLQAITVVVAVAAGSGAHHALAQNTAPDDPVAQAAQVGDARAQAILGQRYMDGHGVLQDYAAAVHWLTRAANAGEPDARNNLGKLYFEGLGVPQNTATAIAWLEKAAESGAPDMLYDLATALESTGQEDALKRAFALYSQGSEAGHVPSATNLGVMYQNGVGIARDLDRAKTLYEMGAATDAPRALNNLGLLYVRGDGVAQDYPRAAELFKRAAEQGLRPALRNLGVLYENGFGVPRDVEYADELYRLAGTGETTGPSPAQIVYDPRLSPPVSTPEGLAAIEAAAQAGDPVAQFQAGWLLSTQPDASGTDWQEAAALFRASALSGFGPAMTNLSFMYFQGKGAPQDFMLGQMWLLLAKFAGAETGPLEAAFGDKPTPAQINHAQIRAKAMLRGAHGNNLPND